MFVDLLMKVHSFFTPQKGRDDEEGHTFLGHLSDNFTCAELISFPSEGIKVQRYAANYMTLLVRRDNKLLS